MGAMNGHRIHPRSAPAAPGERVVLIVVADTVLRRDVERVAAAASCEVRRGTSVDIARPARGVVAVVADESAAQSRSGMAGPPLVVVAADGVPERPVPPGTLLDLRLPRDEAAFVRMLATLDTPDRGRGRVLAVVGAHGGAGTSVLAAAVAAESARGGRSSLLVDLDATGGGIDLLLGVEARDGLRWPDLTVAGGLVDATALGAALPRGPAGEAVLSMRAEGGFEAGADAALAVVAALRRAGGLAVVDAGRGRGDAEQACIDDADLAVVVTTPRVRACAAARDAVRRSAAARRCVLVVRGPSPGGLRAAEVAAAVGSELAAVVRPDPGLDRSLDDGVFAAGPRSSLARAARRVLAEVAR